MNCVNCDQPIGGSGNDWFHHADENYTECLCTHLTALGSYECETNYFAEPPKTANCKWCGIPIFKGAKDWRHDGGGSPYSKCMTRDLQAHGRGYEPNVTYWASPPEAATAEPEPKKEPMNCKYCGQDISQADNTWLHIRLVGLGGYYLLCDDRHVEEHGKFPVAGQHYEATPATPPNCKWCGIPVSKGEKEWRHKALNGTYSQCSKRDLGAHGVSPDDTATYWATPPASAEPETDKEATEILTSEVAMMSALHLQIRETILRMNEYQARLDSARSLLTEYGAVFAPVTAEVQAALDALPLPADARMYDAG